MKTKIILSITLLITVMSFSQNEFINYKAVVKDASGNIVANQNVGVQIEILRESVTVYTETHTKMTDANGVLVLDIGTGTSTDDYSSVVWDRKYTPPLSAFYTVNSLKVGIDITGGTTYVDVGTSDFKSVPYAYSIIDGYLHRKGSGWMLEEDFIEDGEIVFAPGNWGIDMTKHVDGLNFPGGGASGDYSFAAGQNNSATNFGSVALGSENSSSGYGSVVFGTGNSGSAHSVFVSGQYNIGGGSGSTWIPTDPLFEIGNGINDANHSNALTVLKNGTVTAPSVTNALIDIAGDKVLITKEYAMSNFGSSGLQRIDLGSAYLPDGWILDNGEYLDGGFIIGPGNWAIDMMVHEDLLDSDGSASQGTGVSGFYSFGAGGDNAVIGDYAVSFGALNAVEGTGSAMFGYDNWSFGDYSFVHGNANRTNGDYVSAFGKSLNVDAYHSFVLGRYNVGGGTASSWVATEPIFEIGNGTTNTSRSNALTVYKNGNVTMNGVFQYGSSEYIQDQGTFLTGINGGLIPIFNNFDALGSSTNLWTEVFATNGTINTSDRRNKTNIVDLSYGLEQLMELKPVTFNWKTNPNQDAKIGFIAQDLLEVIPEVVKTHEIVADDPKDRSKTKRVEMERMGVYYSDLIPVLVKAIQEQQTTIENLKARVETLENN